MISNFLNDTNLDSIDLQDILESQEIYEIEEILDEENNQHYYLIYYFKNEEVKIIGKSSVKPQCYKQIARYIK